MEYSDFSIRYKPLKFQVSFNSNQNFEIVLGWEDFIDKFLKKVGFREIEIGSAGFDKRYLIKSSDPEKAKKIITLNIQLLFLKYDFYSLSYQTNQNNIASEFPCVIQRMPGNKDMIIEIINMFKLLIDTLLKKQNNICFIWLSERLSLGAAFFYFIKSNAFILSIVKQNSLNNSDNSAFELMVLLTKLESCSVFSHF